MAGLFVAILAASVSQARGLSLMEVSRHAPAAAAVPDPWPTFRGMQESQFGTGSIPVPANLTAQFRWSWHHPGGRYHTVVAGGPVIDSVGNFYLTTNDGIRKFGPFKDLLWHHPQNDNRLNNQASLWHSNVYGVNQNGEAFALDQRDGSTVWRTKLANSSGSDCGYPAAHDGVFVVAVSEAHNPIQPGGNAEVYGLNARTGQTLWSFQPQVPVWNFAPLFTRKGAVVFMDFQGGMYCLGLHDGGLQWHTPVPGANQSFTDGGAVLGPLGDAFSCSNPGSSHGDEGQHGLVRRLNVSDGAVLWEQVLPMPCNSYPAVGKLGPDKELSVVVTPGSFMGTAKTLHGSMMAFDVLTGALRWRFNTRPYTSFLSMAKGDVAGYFARSKYDHGHEICLPAHWSAATIDSDGFAYAGRSDGYVYGVHGGAGVTAPAENSTALANLGVDFASTSGLTVRTWNADGAFLHGAWAFGPGTVAFSTCDTLYTFDA